MTVVTGFTKFPMERLSYDPELDFETRQPKENEHKSMTRVARRNAIYKQFSDPEKVANQYRSGMTLQQLAEQENMTLKQVRSRLMKMRVRMRSAGTYKR